MEQRRDMKVLVAGDVQVVVAGRVERLPEPGANIILQDAVVDVSGVGTNVACDLRDLGIPVDVAAAVGDDPYGEVIRRELTRRGIGIQQMGSADLPTSVFLLLTDANGERTMIGYRGANESLVLSPGNLKGSHIGWLHISGYMLLNPGLRATFGDLVKEARQEGIPCSVDLEGLAQAGLQIDLTGVTVVLCNRDEYRAYFGTEAINAQAGVGRLVVKSGALGCYLGEAGKDAPAHVSAIPCPVADLAGAGDAFNAGLIAARLAGATWPEACRQANAVASRKVAQRGPHF